MACDDMTTMAELAELVGHAPLSGAEGSLRDRASHAVELGGAQRTGDGQVPLAELATRRIGAAFPVPLQNSMRGW
jgi:hypothetical protein